MYNDLRYALRQLMKAPGFTLVAVLTLALGIGINVGIFTILNAAAFRPLPVPGSEQLVSAFLSFAGSREPIHRNVYGDPNMASYSEYRAYRDNNNVFSGLIAYAPFVRATLSGDSPHPVFGALVSCNYFDVLKARPSLGSVFRDSDCSAPGESAVVVLSNDLWRREFHADLSIVGKAITLNRTPFIVVGVAPAGFQGTEAVPAGFWVPLTMQRALVRGADILGDDFCGWLILIGDSFSIPGEEGSKPVEYNHVSPEFFGVLGIPIMRGRNFTDTEYRLGAQVTIITESTARRLWPGKDPIGKTVRKGALRPDALDLEVVGVARDAQVSHLAQSDNLYLYLPAGPKEQSGLQLLAYTPGQPAAIARAIRAAIRELDPELAVNVARLEDNFEYFRFPGRVLAALSGVLGTLALLLALMGVYGMVSYVVSRRVREIGIRMALGAGGHDVTILIVRQALRPVATGVAIGTVCCAAASSILSSVLYGISPRDPLSFLLVPGFLLGVALLASYIPARRAAAVDPMVALRTE